VSRKRARDAEVAGLQALLPPAERGEPRIAPARLHELRPLARIVAGIAGRVTGTGPPSIFTTLGQHPRLFRAWLRYSAQLMPFGHLPRRDSELVILRVAWECRSAYEWHQHVPIALRVGLTPDETSVSIYLLANDTGCVWRHTYDEQTGRPDRSDRATSTRGAPPATAACQVRTSPRSTGCSS
jgi:alkylhydroperoxidase/carboxymuconolactone decarboxylase family protein YurZ